MMNFLEFVSDKYASVQYHHDFGGFLFNRLPVIRNWKWRMVADANVLWGSQRAENEAIVERIPRVNRAGFNFNSLNPAIPYVEVGYGVENIFKIFSVRALHRVTYRDHQDAQKFALKFSMKFSF
jgi:hypothetical protein